MLRPISFLSFPPSLSFPLSLRRCQFDLAALVLFIRLTLAVILIGEVIVRAQPLHKLSRSSRRIHRRHRLGTPPMLIHQTVFEVDGSDFCRPILLELLPVPRAKLTQPRVLPSFFSPPTPTRTSPRTRSASRSRNLVVLRQIVHRPLQQRYLGLQEEITHLTGIRSPFTRRPRLRSFCWSH